MHDGREEKLWKTYARNIMPNGQRKSMCRKIINTTERKFMNVGESIFSQQTSKSFMTETRNKIPTKTESPSRPTTVTFSCE